MKNIINFNDFDTVNENTKQKPKFEKGDIVNYIPKLSGLSPNKKLTIKSSKYESESLFGITSEPTWVYSIEEYPMRSDEDDLKLVKKASK